MPQKNSATQTSTLKLLRHSVNVDILATYSTHSNVKTMANSERSKMEILQLEAGSVNLFSQRQW